MARDVINTRVELDRETDLDARRLAKDQIRSKRQLIAVVMKGVLRVWNAEPEKLRQLRIIQ